MRPSLGISWQVDEAIGLNKDWATGRLADQMWPQLRALYYDALPRPICLDD
jgi:hypothetical protein